MIIACEECQSKFSLEEGLLKETGSKVRCSICKHVFTAFPPKEEPQIEEAPTKKTEETAIIHPEETPKEEDQISEIGDTVSEEIEEEPSKEEEELEAISVEDFSQLDSGAIKKKVEEAEIDKEVSVEEGIGVPEELEREEEEELLKPQPIIEKRPRSRMLLTILLIILILTGIVAALIVFKPGFLPESLPFLKRPLSKEQAFDMGNRRLSFKDLNGTFVDSEKAGKLFLVKGLVTNNYPDKRSFIRIKSNILDSKGTVVKSKIVFAGNPISEKEVLSLFTEEIDNRLGDKLGKDKMNINIQPNSSIPFMIIFSNLPEDMSEFTVEPISSSPAGK